MAVCLLVLLSGRRNMMKVEGKRNREVVLLPNRRARWRQQGSAHTTVKPYSSYTIDGGWVTKQSEMLDSFPHMSYNRAWDQTIRGQQTVKWAGRGWCGSQLCSRIQRGLVSFCEQLVGKRPELARALLKEMVLLPAQKHVRRQTAWYRVLLHKIMASERIFKNLFNMKLQVPSWPSVCLGFVMPLLQCPLPQKRDQDLIETVFLSDL